MRLFELVRAIRTSWLLIMGAALIGGGLGWLVDNAEPESYSAHQTVGITPVDRASSPETVEALRLTMRRYSQVIEVVLSGRTFLIASVSKDDSGASSDDWPTDDIGDIAPPDDIGQIPLAELYREIGLTLAADGTVTVSAHGPSPEVAIERARVYAGRLVAVVDNRPSKAGYRFHAAVNAAQPDVVLDSAGHPYRALGAAAGGCAALALATAIARRRSENVA